MHDRRSRWSLTGTAHHTICLSEFMMVHSVYSFFFFFFSSRRRHTRFKCDWSSDVCSSDLSAKNPRKWARLFECHASFVEPPRKDHSMPPVRIMLPDGSNLRSDEQNTNAILSRFFEREVALVETAPDSPALEEYWPDIDGLAHRETVTEESIALSAPKGSFFDYAVAHVIATNTLNRIRELYPQ